MSFILLCSLRPIPGAFPLLSLLTLDSACPTSVCPPSTPHILCSSGFPTFHSPHPGLCHRTHTSFCMVFSPPLIPHLLCSPSRSPISPLLTVFLCFILQTAVRASHCICHIILSVRNSPHRILCHCTQAHTFPVTYLMLHLPCSNRFRLLIPHASFFILCCIPCHRVHTSCTFTVLSLHPPVSCFHFILCTTLGPHGLFVCRSPYSTLCPRTPCLFYTESLLSITDSSEEALPSSPRSSLLIFSTSF